MIQKTSSHALIFDLDDTLFDTYGQLVLKAHYEACEAMCQQGLDVNVDELYQTRMRLISESPREEINALLAAYYHDFRPEIIKAGIDAYYNTDIQGIQLLPDATDLLKDFPETLKFLVTAGSQKTQAAKVKELQIADYFREIIYVDNIYAQETKEEAFAKILETYSLLPQNTIVIGDRVQSEIQAANTLQCISVLIKRGEFSHVEPLSDEETPTYTAFSLKEIQEIIRNHLCVSK